MIPRLVHFDRYAQLTFGLIAEGFAPQVQVNGMALVTGWLSNGPWFPCQDDVSTSWAACQVAPTTVWTAI